MDCFSVIRQRCGELQILLCVVLFGLAFVVQRVGVTASDSSKAIGPITFNACRYIVSTLLMVVVVPLLQSLKKTNNHVITNQSMYDMLLYGVGMGFFAWGGSTLQQIGLVHTDIGKTAFITSLYVICVPIMECLVTCQSLSHATWAAAIVSVVGTYYVSGFGGSSFTVSDGYSELLVVFAMLFWTLLIMVTDRGCRKCDAIILTSVGFFFTALFCVISGIIYEPEYWVYPFTSITTNISLIITLGVLETAAYVFCSLGQMTVESSRAALLLSLEAVSGALCGYVFLHEVMNGWEIFGCFLMLLSFFVSVIDWNIHDIYHYFTHRVHPHMQYELIPTNEYELSTSLSNSLKKQTELQSYQQLVNTV